MRLRSFACIRCGAAIAHRAGALSAHCQMCGRTLTQDEVREIEDEGARRYPNPTPLLLGMKARFKEREYELTGRIVFGMVEGGATYTWEEFELVAPDGDCLFLEYDMGQWRLTEPFVPKNPVGPDDAARLGYGARLDLDGSVARVTQLVHATVRFVEGELTYRAMVGDKVAYLDAASYTKAKFYSVEWSEDEIEFYRGKSLSLRQVREAFGLSNTSATTNADDQRPETRKRFAMVCFVLAMVAFLSWIFTDSNGTRVSVGPDTQLHTIPAEGVRFGPIMLDPLRGVHRLTVRGAMSQSSAWVAAVLETPEEFPLVTVQGDLWDESGSDSDGSWHEWFLQEQTYFVVPKPGLYYVRLYAEKDFSSKEFDTASYALYSGIFYPSYLPTYGFFALIMSVVFLFASKTK
jgi:hypothetical protein